MSKKTKSKPDDVTYKQGEEVRKTFIAEIKSINEKDFTIEAVVTDESIDSYGEIILATAWKKRMKRYQSHPVLMSSHNYYDLRNQIGETVRMKINKENQMVVTFKYYVGMGNAIADWAWTLVTLKAASYSVGFKVYAYEVTSDWMDDKEVLAGKKPRRTFTDIELLEISHVTIPANSNALQNSLTEGDPILRHISEGIKARDFSKDNTAMNFEVALKEVLIKLDNLEQGDEVLFDKSAEPSNKEVNINPEYVTQMVTLLKNDEITTAERKKLYDELSAEYTKANKTAPDFIPYNFEEDIIMGCSDVETALKLLKILTQTEEETPNESLQTSETIEDDEAGNEIKSLSLKMDALLDMITETKKEEEDSTATIEKSFIADMLNASNILTNKTVELKQAMEETFGQSNKDDGQEQE